MIKRLSITVFYRKYRNRLSVFLQLLCPLFLASTNTKLGIPNSHVYRHCTQLAEIEIEIVESFDWLRICMPRLAFSYFKTCYLPTRYPLPIPSLLSSPTPAQAPSWCYTFSFGLFETFAMPENCSFTFDSKVCLIYAGHTIVICTTLSVYVCIL